MSDWEDEYDKNGVALEQKPAPKSASAHYKLPENGGQSRGNVSFGGRRSSREPRESRGGGGGGGGVLEFRSQRGPRDGGAKRSETENSDSSKPVVITVENTSVGRVIGMFCMLKPELNS